jgi:hypothetical protein
MVNICMKTLREMMDLIESAQAPVAEGYTPTAGELAQDLIGLADADFNKKYGMSKQQANRYYSSSKLKDQGMAEGETSQQYTVAVDCGEDGTFTVKVHAGDKGEALRKAQKIVRNEYDTYPEGARIVGQGLEEQLEETDADPVRRIEELFQDRH